MLIREEEDLNSIQTEVFDILISYDVEKNNKNREIATRRIFEARRALEKRRERQELETYLDMEKWFDD